MPGVKRGMSSSRYTAYKSQRRNRYSTSRAAASRMSKRGSRSTRQVVRRAVMGMSETKEINCISNSMHLPQNQLPTVALSAVNPTLGQNSRNLTYCLQGHQDGTRDGANVHGLNVDMNIVFDIPTAAAEGLTLAPVADNTMARVVCYEADMHTVKDMKDTLESKLFTPTGLIQDPNLTMTYLNRKDFRIISDDIINVTPHGHAAGRPHQYVYRKNIPINKNVAYNANSYVPTKQIGVCVVGHSSQATDGHIIGMYRVAWKYAWKDI